MPRRYGKGVPGQPAASRDARLEKNGKPLITLSKHKCTCGYGAVTVYIYTIVRITTFGAAEVRSAEMNLETLLQRSDIWRGGEHDLRDRAAGEAARAIPSGHETLDAQLPDGGWPLGALTELLSQRQGIGELRLLLPALARLSRQGRWLVWVTPPHVPYAPALTQAGIELSRLLLVRHGDAIQQLWAMEQALRSGTCGAVLGWPAVSDNRVLRRLQLAAEAGHALGVLFRPWAMGAHASPAALRLRLESASDGLVVQILKRRGGWRTHPVLVRTDHAVA